ncbi:cytochrome b [Bradyrhizobium sp. G127]|uniref:cytochrome b n=1 Tax=Bradyrhizobium sp. G127 TaxID=2904800 RepID=UPI001F28DA5C|nr:cytochrome b [Bradyrhizobium sp. G127]MCF2521696.1 cytochrome b [Bradyrhizobium sp. G127]
MLKSARSYGATAKALHWLVVVLLIVQYLIGWLMQDVHGGPPGTAMVLHISFGILILALIAFRLAWRLMHPVAQDASLPAWQRNLSELVHWLLYAFVLATTLSGWLFASARGWTVSLFFAIPLPMLTSQSPALIYRIDGLHQIMEWTLLAVIGVHVGAALLHLLVYRDRVLQQMLPGEIS